MFRKFLGPLGACMPTVYWGSGSATDATKKPAMSEADTQSFLQRMNRRIEYEEALYDKEVATAKQLNQANKRDQALAALKRSRAIKTRITNTRAMADKIQAGLDGLYMAQQQAEVLAAYKATNVAMRDARSQVSTEEVGELTDEMTENFDNMRIMQDLLGQEMPTSAAPVSDADLEAELDSLDEEQPLRPPAQSPVKQPAMKSAASPSGRTTATAAAAATGAQRGNVSFASPVANSGRSAAGSGSRLAAPDPFADIARV
jgi:hypothetical protein